MPKQSIETEHAIFISPSRGTYHAMVRWVGKSQFTGEPWDWWHMQDGTWEYLAWDAGTVKRFMAQCGVASYVVIEQEPTHYPEKAPIHGHKPQK